MRDIPAFVLMKEIEQVISMKQRCLALLAILLLLGLAVAFVGLVPWLAPVHGVLSRAADLLTGLLNGWAVWLSTKPGAAIYFDTTYAALVCLLLCGLGVLAFRWRVRLRAFSSL